MTRSIAKINSSRSTCSNFLTKNYNNTRTYSNARWYDFSEFPAFSRDENLSKDQVLKRGSNYVNITYTKRKN